MKLRDQPITQGNFTAPLRPPIQEEDRISYENLKKNRENNIERSERTS